MHESVTLVSISYLTKHSVYRNLYRFELDSAVISHFLLCCSNHEGQEVISYQMFKRSQAHAIIL